MERVPPFADPALTDLAPFEDHVLSPSLSETNSSSSVRRASADDDCIDLSFTAISLSEPSHAQSGFVSNFEFVLRVYQSSLCASTVKPESRAYFDQEVWCQPRRSHGSNGTPIQFATASE